MSEFDADCPGRLAVAKASAICMLVESLRASSLARREADLVGTLRDRAAKHQFTTTVRPTRHVDVHCNNDRFARAIPSVGVPDSEAIHACALPSADGNKPTDVVLLYDSFNVTKHWKKHLDWLGNYLPVRTVKIFEIDEWLDELCR